MTLKKRIKEHISACIDKFLNVAVKKLNNSNKIMNAIKESAIAEHLVKNQSCAENFNLERFKTSKSCYNVFDLVKV